MLTLARILMISLLAAVVTSLLVTGAVGLWAGLPLAFLEALPGDETEELQQLPKILALAGIGGGLVGLLGGISAQLAGRISPVISTLVIGLSVILTLRWTHPGLNLSLDAGWLDYLESYRLTLLAALASATAVILAGWMMKPFRRNRSGVDRTA